MNTILFIKRYTSLINSKHANILDDKQWNTFFKLSITLNMLMTFFIYMSTMLINIFIRFYTSKVTVNFLLTVFNKINQVYYTFSCKCVINSEKKTRISYRHLIHLLWQCQQCLRTKLYSRWINSIIYFYNFHALCSVFI